MQKHSLVLFGSSAIAAAFLLAGCAGPAGAAGPPGPQGPAGSPGPAGPAAPAPAPKTQTFNIQLGEGEVLGVGETLGDQYEHKIVGEYHRWEPGVLVVHKGDKVVLNVSNPRKAVHSFLLKAYGIDTGKLTPRTGKKTVEFVADKVGAFEYVCGVDYDPKAEPHECDPDHKRMTGQLIVLDR